jgi:hypothetical protein
MRRVTWANAGLTAVMVLIALVLVLGGAPTTHAGSGLSTAAQPKAAVTSTATSTATNAPATGPITITTTFTSNFTTNGLAYITLPYNITWNVSLTNTTIGPAFTQVINISFVNSILCPLFFPCLPVYQDHVNPAWVTNLTATSGSYYYPLTLANLTDQNYLGFTLPQGTWIVSIWDNYDDGAGNTSNFEVDHSVAIAMTPPAGVISQPASGANVTAGSTVIAGYYSGYFVVSANVTVYNSTGASVLSIPVYAPGSGQHPFAIKWPALTPGTYSIAVILAVAWNQVYTFSSTVNVVAGIPVTYFNQTNTLIPGLGNGGSAALLVTLGAIVGMIVMLFVGRGTWGGPKATPAQPWSSQPAQPSGAATDSSGGAAESGSGSGQTPPT